jgi:hypothetical protein
MKPSDALEQFIADLEKRLDVTFKNYEKELIGAAFYGGANHGFDKASSMYKSQNPTTKQELKQ